MLISAFLMRSAKFLVGSQEEEEEEEKDTIKTVSINWSPL